MPFGQSCQVYGKIVSSNTSRLEPNPGFYKLLMKGIFDLLAKNIFEYVTRINNTRYYMLNQIRY